jgi:hypothetical protein
MIISYRGLRWVRAPVPLSKVCAGAGPIASFHFIAMSFPVALVTSLSLSREFHVKGDDGTTSPGGREDPSGAQRGCCSLSPLDPVIQELISTTVTCSVVLDCLFLGRYANVRDHKRNYTLAIAIVCGA